MAILRTPMFWCAKEALAQAARELQAAQEAAQAQQAALEQLGSCMVEICEDILNVMTYDDIQW